MVLASARGHGHEGTEKTLHRLHADFFVPGAHAAIRDFVCACITCQHNKTEHLHPMGLMQPVEVPMTAWADVIVDFIEGLPQVSGISVILTIINMFSKYCHFLSLGHPYRTMSVVRLFFDNVVKLHRIPSSIVSDRDPVFTGNFWRELFKLAGVKLQMSSTFHPNQTDTRRRPTRLLRCNSDACSATVRAPGSSRRHGRSSATTPQSRCLSRCCHFGLFMTATLRLCARTLQARRAYLLSTPS
jgi:hypothetical protein